jgi:hypothetical protein
MTSNSEKVKDLIEAMPFKNISSDQKDPEVIVESYKFTPLTSDLMSIWLKRIAGFEPGGPGCFAVAGKRGVGKSHFLSAFAAICADSRSRMSIGDEHIRANCEAFGGAEFVVLRIFRGTGETFTSELRTAVERELRSDLPVRATAAEALETLASGIGRRPIVLIIDSNPGRKRRITRDDGPELGSLAENAQRLGLFVGLALDDDISGADGPNVEVANRFAIDYLDPQHLFQIIDTFVFPKKDGTRPDILKVYRAFTGKFPAFKWSEERFSALYPLHPESLDIAPFVRYYVPDFALLGFAAAAAVKIMGRPAESLIGLDEMYDSVEGRLREHDELKDTFVKLDRVDRDVLDQLPMPQRYPARLAFKYLILRSLTGSPSTSEEIETGALIEKARSPLDLQRLLKDIAAMEGSPVRSFAGESGKPAFLLEGIEVEKEGYEVLPETAISGEIDDFRYELLRFAGWHFSDISGPDILEPNGSPAILEWQNTLRRGRIIYHSQSASSASGDEFLDWTIIVAPKEAAVQVGDDRDGPVRAIWRVPSLTKEESRSVTDYIRIVDSDIEPDEVNDDVETRKLKLAIERILTRVLVSDAHLELGNTKFSFTEEDRDKHTVAYLFSPLFDDVFSSRFPDHPTFKRVVGAKEFSALVSKFLLGGEANSPDTQKLAQDVAAPMGLAVQDGGEYRPANSKELSVGRFSSEPAALIEAASEKTPLSDLERVLRSEPFGLSLEARQILITSLIAAFGLEYVTARGSRIGSSSLDLQIVWEDIVAVARPLHAEHAADEISQWCELIISEADPRAAGSVKISDIAGCLAFWLKRWRERGLLDKLETVPAEALTLRTWKKAESVRRSLGKAATIVSDWLAGEGKAEDCMSRFIDCFKGSQDVYSLRWLDAAALEAEIAAENARRADLRYLSYSFATEEIGVERFRVETIEAAADGSTDKKVDAFRANYAEQYSRLHEKAKNDADELLSVISGRLGDERWGLFVQASELPWFARDDRKVLADYLSAAGRIFCDSVDPAAIIAVPVCGCGFDLRGTGRVSAGNLETFASRATERFVSNVIDGLADSKDESAIALREKFLVNLASGERVEIDAHSLESLWSLVSADAA